MARPPQDELDAFMRSLRMQESSNDYRAESPWSSASGAYQYIDSTWGNYKGYRRAKDAPPEVQDERVRQDIIAAYEKFDGDWAKVAANHMFPAWADSPEKWNRPAAKGNPPMIEYVGEILGRAGLGSQTLGMESSSSTSDSGAGLNAGNPEPDQREREVRARALIPRAENFLRGALGSPVQQDRQSVLSALGMQRLDSSAIAPSLPFSPVPVSDGSGLGSVNGPGDAAEPLDPDAGLPSGLMSRLPDADRQLVGEVAGPPPPNQPPSQSFAQRRPTAASSSIEEAPDVARDELTDLRNSDTQTSSPPPTGGALSASSATPATGEGLSIDPLLNLAEALENSSANVLGLGSDLSSIVDPALMASLGQLGLSEDLGTLDALEEATRLLLGAGEQRRRLQRGFKREQELTGANLGDRGIEIRKSEAGHGLVGATGRALGEQQGESLADFNAAVGDQFRGILSGLGNEQLGNLGGLGQTLLTGITGNLEDALNQIPDFS